VTRASLARALLGLGEVDAAIEQARQAVEVAAARSDALATANAALAEAALVKGSTEEALDAANKAFAAWMAGGVSSGWESTIRLVQVRALRAAGRVDEARAAQLEARRSLARRTTRMRDEDARIAFLAQPENVAILARTNGE
jgi:tetratricopeptide (TPR) repeat protein